MVTFISALLLGILFNIIRVKAFFKLVCYAYFVSWSAGNFLLYTISPYTSVTSIKAKMGRWYQDLIFERGPVVGCAEGSRLETCMCVFLFALCLFTMHWMGTWLAVTQYDNSIWKSDPLLELCIGVVYLRHFIVIFAEVSTAFIQRWPCWVDGVHWRCSHGMQIIVFLMFESISAKEWLNA